MVARVKFSPENALPLMRVLIQKYFMLLELRHSAFEAEDDG